MLASYACKYQESQGRLYQEAESKNRSSFQRDRDRIIHSQCFRRLEYKTQVFVNYESDHFRTRLTHSLEVAQISRVIAKKLKLDQDLAEAIALAHDIGHPPFGHAGEDALNAAMKKYGGFDHNAQSLKNLIQLESPYAEFEGLNLSFETLDGILKHNGPITSKRGLPKIILKYAKLYKFKLKKNTSLEAQVAAIADDIAYNNHDIDDGFRANLLKEEDFAQLKLVRDAFSKTKQKYPNISWQKQLHEARGVIYSTMVNDVIEQTLKNIKKYKIKTYQDVLNCKHSLADFSPAVKKQVLKLKEILKDRIYTHHKIQIMCRKSHKIITDLFEFYIAHPNCLNEELRSKFYQERNSKDRARIICNFIAGMTDRFAITHHQELFDIYSLKQSFR